MFRLETNPSQLRRLVLAAIHDFPGRSKLALDRLETLSYAKRPVTMKKVSAFLTDKIKK